MADYVPTRKFTGRGPLASLIIGGALTFGFYKCATREIIQEPVKPVYTADSNVDSTTAIGAVKKYPNTFEGRLERLRDGFNQRTEDTTFDFLAEVQTMLDDSKANLEQSAYRRAEEILTKERSEYLDNSKKAIKDSMSKKED